MENRDKLYVYIIKRGENSFELAGLSEDKLLWCILPVEYQSINIHTVLLSKPTIKSAISAIKPVNGYRKVGIKIDESIRMEYFDEDDNLCYKNIPLEETSICTNLNVMKSEQENFLIKKINELESVLNTKEVKLHEVEKKFVLDTFDKKHNPIEWLTQFNAECTRHNVNTDVKIIEVLRFFVEGPSKDWYEANIKKLGLQNWPIWKQSFLTVFVDKGWAKVRKAYNFKYIGGSFVDYALAKERFCLEAESNSTVISRIHMIVVGLPFEIQDELDREELKTTEELFTALRRVDSFSRVKRNYTQSMNVHKVPDYKQKGKYEDQRKKTSDTSNRKPCFICEALGFPNRYHLATDCRNKNLYVTKKQVNINELLHTDIGETAEMLSIDVEKKN